MKCVWCKCVIEDGEEQYTDDEGPFCIECFEEAEAEAEALDFRRIA